MCDVKIEQPQKDYNSRDRWPAVIAASLDVYSHDLVVRFGTELYFS